MPKEQIALLASYACDELLLKSRKSTVYPLSELREEIRRSILGSPAPPHTPHHLERLLRRPSTAPQSGTAANHLRHPEWTLLFTLLGCFFHVHMRPHARACLFN